ncbi:hypothetical protein E2542_SST30246 [Spatholobus suberectus]|nr:hypothetical protein E2542_SST30246 [Spatholobus suberectus]
MLRRIDTDGFKAGGWVNRLRFGELQIRKERKKREMLRKTWAGLTKSEDFKSSGDKLDVKTERGQDVKPIPKRPRLGDAAEERVARGCRIAKDTHTRDGDKKGLLLSFTATNTLKESGLGLLARTNCYPKSTGVLSNASSICVLVSRAQLKVPPLWYARYEKKSWQFRGLNCTN